MQRWYSMTVAGAVVVAGLAVTFWVYGPGLTPELPNNSPAVAIQPAPIQPAPVQPPAFLNPPKVDARERPAAAVDQVANPGGAAIVNAPGPLMRSSNLLVIPNCHAQVIYKQEVPSQRDGQLLYVATEIQPEDRAELKPEKIVTVKESYLYIEMRPNETAPADEIQQAKVTRESGAVEIARYRRVHDNDDIAEAWRLDRLKPLSRELRLLKEGDEVKEGQLLALVDPALTLDEFDIKKTKYYAATADWAASEKTRDEAKERYDTLMRLYRSATPGSAPYEEVRGGKLTWDRYFLEAISKREAIKQADRELSQMLTQTKMHEIRAKITGGTGIVKIIYKQKGDAVKNQEPVMQLWHYDRLRIEGRVEMQHMAYLHQGKTVVIEPTLPRGPRAVFSGHLQEVRGVAVSKDRKIVSASDDRTVRVWDPVKGTAETPWVHATAVLAVACSPKAYTDRNLCLSGGSDGQGRLWDLDVHSQDPVLVLQGKHQGPVNCVAFSPTGKWCVTGGDDRTICLWNTANGERLQQFKNDGHGAGITSLQFLSDQVLVSAGKDKQLIRWTLDANGALQGQPKKIAIRSNDVAIVGGCPVKRQLLVDKGKEIQVLQMPEGDLVGSLQNASDGMNFSTMAMFSPDGNLILTGSQSDSRLQLWRAPTADWRAYELRQLIWPGEPATCAAFAPMDDSEKPEDQFLVTGTADRQVVVWDMPDKKEVQDRLTATVTLVEPSLDTASREVRIWAELDNPRLPGTKDHRLIPGQGATMVVPPGK